MLDIPEVGNTWTACKEVEVMSRGKKRQKKTKERLCP